MYRGGRKQGTKDKKPRSRIGWTDEKREAMAQRYRALSLQQEVEAMERITAPGGPPVTELARRFGVSRASLVKTLDRLMGADARRAAVRARQSEAMRGNLRGQGRKMPKEVRARWKQERRGPGNPNWKGGHRNKRDGRISIRHLVEYKEFVEFILERDGRRCVRCESTEYLVVHHKVPEEEAPQMLMDPDNAETLCRRCHMKHHKPEQRRRP